MKSAVIGVYRLDIPVRDAKSKPHAVVEQLAHTNSLEIRQAYLIEPRTVLHGSIASIHWQLYHPGKWQAHG